MKYKLPIKIFIFKNNMLGQIQWEQMVLLGNPEFGCELDPNIDFVKYAEACGAGAFRADDPKTCGQVVERALAYSGPAVVECIVDPHEPPMPGQITSEQALRFAESIARGTKDSGKIIRDVLGDKVRELV
jgi:thiamine pyrophosphate-dependent acetolactate synthase large subunit-like protein